MIPLLEGLILTNDSKAMDDIDKIVSAAKAGGDILKKYFGESLETTQKTNASDFRTKADLESEAVILEILESEFPHHTIISEEKGEIRKESDYTFIIDPLDGTNNFVLGIPNFSISICLLNNDELVSGVIFCPMIDNVYYAQKGGGAFCDGKRIIVNKESDITHASIAENCNYETPFQEEVAIFHGLYTKDAKRVMSNWSPTFDFCMLASGKIEGIVNNNCELYDFTAGKLIAREAGALITDFRGNPETNDKNSKFVASNGTAIHAQLIDVTASISKMNPTLR